MPPRDFQPVIDRFVATCQADERVVAAFLFGSLAHGDADEHSDLDLCLIAADEARNDLWAGSFMRCNVWRLDLLAAPGSVEGHEEGS